MLLIIFEVIYILITILVCMRIIYDTRSFSKTLAYLLLVIFLPLFGMIFYFSFGINYRKRKIYSKKLIIDAALAKSLKANVYEFSKETFTHAKDLLEPYNKLWNLVSADSFSGLMPNNRVDLLINGENKFPEVIRAMESAKDHIHLEYYIYDDDEIGRTIEQILIKKAREGVKVRFIYDDFGSHAMSKKMVPRLRAAGVKVFPFYKISFFLLANRINYRNHRKIIVVDGIKAFVGGINVSDKYINHPDKPEKLYWRDTHLYIEGIGAYYLQYLFLCSWNYCASDNLSPNHTLFPSPSSLPTTGDKIIQIVASGPDSQTPTILFSLLQIINLAREELLITTPYFIPGESIIDALIVSALGGVSVKLLVPGISDSRLVNAAARSYYGDLLRAGVEIYTYQKGFVHAKTIVADKNLAVVGTANMDYRSFDLNFEVNAMVHDAEIAEQLSDAFYRDLQSSDKIDAIAWLERSKGKQLIEKTARLVSPFL